MDLGFQDFEKTSLRSLKQSFLASALSSIHLQIYVSVYRKMTTATCCFGKLSALDSHPLVFETPLDQGPNWGFKKTCKSQKDKHIKS